MTDAGGLARQELVVDEDEPGVDLGRLNAIYDCPGISAVASLNRVSGLRVARLG